MSRRCGLVVLTFALVGSAVALRTPLAAGAAVPPSGVPAVGTALVGGTSPQGIVEANASTAASYLIPGSTGQQYEAAWNSDGNRVALFTPGITNLVGIGPSTLTLSNVDGGCVSVVSTPDNLPSASAPAWAPDGLHLAVDLSPDGLQTGPGRVGIVRQDGTGLAVIGPGGSALAGPHPWSPDGTRLLVTTTAGLQVFAVASGQMTTLYAAPGLAAVSASWSPDGETVVFSPASGKGPTSSGVFLVRSDGSGLRSLTSGPDWFPSVSPDGGEVVFLRSAAGQYGPGDLWIVRTDGSGASALTTHEVADTAPLWSPDGSQIASAVAGSAYVITPPSSNRYFIGTFQPTAFFTEKAAVRGGGYRIATSDGTVGGFGTRCALGSAPASGAPIVGMATTPSGNGYWLVASNGVVSSVGAAVSYGSASGLTAPIVGMASTPSGRGYWLVAADGRIVVFGDAAALGSAATLALKSPIVGMAPTPSGRGYWLVAADGGIFSYGDAAFHGSTGAIHLNAPIVGMASTPSGKGYWFVAADGGIFNYGDAAFYGSTGAIHLNAPIVGMASTPSGRGYWLVAADGGMFTFGDARYTGSLPEAGIAGPAVAMAG